MRVLILMAAAALAGCGDGGDTSAHFSPAGDIRVIEPAAPAASAEPEVTHSVSSTGMPTMTKRMSFQECLQTVRSMATDLGVAPTNIVETSELRIVRFNTTDGSVLVTCSAADGKLVAVQSPHRG